MKVSAANGVPAWVLVEISLVVAFLILPLAAEVATRGFS